MVIRHSMELLEQLHELEGEIQAIERLAKAQGMNLESETLLRLALLKRKKAKSSLKSLTETGFVS